MIYLVRHGETLWNTLGRFQGHLDSPLTQRGMDQADHVAKLLAREVDGNVSRFRLHVSPLGRAKQTAQLIVKQIPLPVEHSQSLIEVTTGSWDGMSFYEIDMEYPGHLSGSDAFDWYFRSPDGETFDDAWTRVKAWLAEVSSPTIAVTHGLTGRLLRGAYLGLSRRDCLQLPVPQDGFFRLKDRQVDLIT